MEVVTQIVERVPERFSNIRHGCSIRLFCGDGTVQLFHRPGLDIRNVVERPLNQFMDVEVRYENWDKELAPNTARGIV